MGKMKVLLTVLSLMVVGAALFWYFSKKDLRSLSVENGGVVYTANILEAREMAVHEAGMLNMSDQSLDSLEARYSPSTLVDLDIDLSQLKDVDVSSLGAASEEEYNARYYVLQFRIHEFIALEFAEQEYEPVLTQATIQSSTNQIKIRLTFPIPQKEFLAAGGSLRYSDPFFTKEDITFAFN